MTEHDFGEAVSESERRGSDRKKLIIDVRFDGGDGTGIANTRDIGSGGLYMTTTADLEQGTPIMMTMTISGMVVYSDPGYGVGVRFRDLDADDQQFLQQELQLA